MYQGNYLLIIINFVILIYYYTAFANPEGKAMEQPFLLKITMSSNAISYGKPLEVIAVIINNANHQKTITLPIGNDYRAVFSCKLTDTNTKEAWYAQEFSERSFAALVDTELLPGKEHKIILHNLRFSKDNHWSLYLPVGDYQIQCLYDIGKAIKSDNNLSIASNIIQFFITPK